MAHPFHHALSSVRRWGGCVADYQKLHDWFDESKKMMADFRHRALRHHAEGIFMLEQIFGTTVTLSTGKVIPTRWVGEQHVKEDLGFIPSMQDWFKHITPQKWMGNAAVKLERELERSERHGNEDQEVRTQEAGQDGVLLERNLPPVGAYEVPARSL